MLSHDKYENLYNLAPIAYLTLNSDGLVIDVNHAGLELLGLKKHMLINRCFSLNIFPESQLAFAQYQQHALKNQTIQSCELKLLRWSGSAFEAKIKTKAIQCHDSDNMQLLICITDISAQKLSERNLHLQQSRMATIEKSRSMNEQVYSISNHQNHSLTLINNYIYGCIRRIETEKFDSDELLQSLKKVALQSRTLSDIIVQMKQFTGKSVLRYGLVDINTVINEVLSLIYLETIEFPIAIQYVPINQPLLLKLDKLHIQHVILNLARNSIEAMRDAKTLEPKLYIEVRLVNSHEITINVLDNGPGFDMLACEKLFEPHFTTKAYAFGLGLSVARSIIEKHNGELIAQKNAPSGACFQITLPRSLQSEDVAASI